MDGNLATIRGLAHRIVFEAEIPQAEAEKGERKKNLIMFAH